MKKTLYLNPKLYKFIIAFVFIIALLPLMHVLLQDYMKHVSLVEHANDAGYQVLKVYHPRSYTESQVVELRESLSRRFMYDDFQKYSKTKILNDTTIIVNIIPQAKYDYSIDQLMVNAAIKFAVPESVTIFMAEKIDSILEADTTFNDESSHNLYSKSPSEYLISNIDRSKEFDYYHDMKYFYKELLTYEKVKELLGDSLEYRLEKYHVSRDEAHMFSHYTMVLLSSYPYIEQGIAT